MLDRIAKHSPGPRLDLIQLEKVKGDGHWLDACIDRIFVKLPKAHQNIAVEWLKNEGADLGAVMKASLEQSLTKTRERLVLFTVLLVLGFAATPLITNASGLVAVIAGFGMLAVVIGGVGAGILGIMLLDEKSRCKKLSVTTYIHSGRT